MLPAYLKGVAVAAAVAVVFGAGWAANGWRLGSKLSDLRAQHAEAEQRDSSAGLTQLQDASKQVAQAASQAVASVDAARARLAALKGPYAKPLPADCRPDDERLRRRNAAIEAYNAARAGSVPGP